MQVSKYMSVSRANVTSPLYLVTVKSKNGMESCTISITLEQLATLARYGQQEINTKGARPELKVVRTTLRLIEGEKDE